MQTSQKGTLAGHEAGFPQNSEKLHCDCLALVRVVDG
jgi:hypothetical protein